MGLVGGEALELVVLQRRIHDLLASGGDIAVWSGMLWDGTGLVLWLFDLPCHILHD